MPDDGPDAADDTDLRQQLQELQARLDRIEELEERVDTLEDRTLMTDLEELSIEEEVSRIQETLGAMDSNELEDKLQLLQKIEDEYRDSMVHDKLNYLYQEIQALKEQQGGSNDLEGRVEELERQVENEDGGDEHLQEKVSDLEDKVYTLRDRIEELKDKLDDADG